MLGDNLRLERLKRHLKQEYVAQKANIHQSTVSRFETGEADPRYSELQAVTGVIGCSIKDVCDDEPLQLKPRAKGKKKKENGRKTRKGG